MRSEENVNTNIYTSMGKPGRDGVHGERAGGAHSVDGEQVLPSLKVLKFDSSNSYDQPGNSECVRARTHRVCCPRTGPRESSARRVCASPSPVPGGGPRACARTQRLERAHACCRPPAALRARVWNKGPKAQGGREHATPAKAAHPLAAGVHEGRAHPAAQASRPRAASPASG